MSFWGFVRATRLRPGSGGSQRAAVALALRSLARRVRQLRSEAQALAQELARRVEALAPELLARRGVGPISAAALLVAWSEPGRLRSEAAFARLAGVAPTRRSAFEPGAAHDRLEPAPGRPRDAGVHRPPRQ